MTHPEQPDQHQQLAWDFEDFARSGSALRLGALGGFGIYAAFDKLVAPITLEMSVIEQSILAQYDGGEQLRFYIPDNDDQGNIS